MDHGAWIFAQFGLVFLGLVSIGAGIFFGYGYLYNKVLPIMRLRLAKRMYEAKVELEDREMARKLAITQGENRSAEYTYGDEALRSSIKYGDPGYDPRNKRSY